VPKLPETIRRSIPFAGGAKAFQVDGKAEIDDIVKFAVAYPNSKILIEGHTDNTGAPAVNRKLSLERAKAVAEILVGAGVNADRITTVGVGMDRPLTADSNKTPEGRRRNRRVDVTLSEEN
jgi:outer membrane protein OmpA-like peptidoglycan-associated protein